MSICNLSSELKYVIMDYLPCICEKHAPKPYVELTSIMLADGQKCLQTRFSLVANDFRDQMNRLPTTEDWKIITDFIQAHQVKDLNIRYIDIPQHVDINFDQLQYVSLISVSLPTATLQIITKNLLIKQLRLCGNTLSNDDAFYLRQFMVSNKVLECLDVGWCGLDPARFAMIADGVINCPSLDALDMSRPIGQLDKIASIIAIIIQRSNLTEAHFEHCNLGCHDIIPICEYLVGGKSSKLRYLDLGSNRLGSLGTDLLFGALKQSSELLGLDISNNQAGSDGGESIARCLPFTKIKHLDIARNGIPPRVIESILRSTRKPYKVNVLKMAGNVFDYGVGELLRRLIFGGVFSTDSLDVDVTYDKDVDGFRVVPVHSKTSGIGPYYLPSLNGFS